MYSKMFTGIRNKWRYRAYSKNERQAVIWHEIAKRLMQRLDYINLRPASILNLGVGTTYLTGLLQNRYPTANIVVVERDFHSLAYAKSKSARARAGFMCADNVMLPIASQAIDLIVAHLSLAWCKQPHKLLLELKRLLKPNGLLVFTTLGPDTLKELPGYFSQPVNSLIQEQLLDMHAIGDKLLQLEFSDPVMEMEMLQVNFTRPTKMLAELAALQVLATPCPELNTAASPFLTTFEIIYGHAWQGNLKPSHNGEIYIPIASIGRLHK
jgi:malonyl-CoA O-methyltransferase